MLFWQSKEVSQILVLVIVRDSFGCRRNVELREVLYKGLERFLRRDEKELPKKNSLQVSLSKLEGEETSTKNDISFLYSQLACTAVDLRPKHYEIEKNNAP